MAVIPLVSGSWTLVQDSEALAEDTWYHVAVTYDGSNEMKLYKNGELVDSNTRVSQLGNDISAYIGKAHTGYWFGEIDEVRIWNVARTQAEIQAYMKSTLTGTESNLVVYYQFDQSSGTNLEDTTGSYDGTLNGDPQWEISDALLTEMAPPGNALSFDGTDDYVALPNESSFDFSADFSVEAWIQVDSFTKNWQAIITKGDNSWRLARYKDNNSLHFTINKASGGGVNVFGSTNVKDGAWHGENAQQSGRNFHGSMDEVRIWTVARSESEIQAYMNRTLDGYESGLLAYYTFDEVIGSNNTATLTDTTGSNDGTLNGGPTWTASGATLSKVVAPGNALSFDGTDDYVELPYILDPAAGSFTAETWFKLDSLPNAYQMLIAQAAGRSWLYIPDTTGYKLRSFLGATSLDGVTGLSAGIWYHTVVTYDGTTLSLYLNGEFENSASRTMESHIGDLLLGIYTDISSMMLNGDMDEVRIWDVARSQTEIQANMYTSLTSFETGLVAYYKFDQDSGTEMVDITSFDHDGTLNGGPTWVESGVPMD